MRFLENRPLPKPLVFGLLMAASFVTTMLPPEMLARARNLAQPLGLPQWLMQTASLETRRAAMILLSRRVPSEEYDRLAAERDALQTEMATLRHWNVQLQSTVAELANVRKMGFPAHGTLIPARILGMDAAPGRDSMSVGKGNVQKVERNDWVISGLTVGAGTEQGVEPLTQVIGRQYLIGWVEDVAPLTSRVILLSDKLAGKARPRKVLISPLDASTRPVENEQEVFVLEPLGSGKMIIRDVPRRMVEAGQVQVGDLVTSTPDDTRLPLSVVIGPIEDLQPNRDKPICFDAIVRHMVNPANMSEVFIVDLSQPASTSPASP